MKRFNNLLRRSVSAMVAVLVLTMLFGAAAFAQTTAFTYQGRLSEASMSHAERFLPAEIRALQRGFGRNAD